VKGESIMKIVLSGGGTGGHIYPALAMAREIKKLNPEASFLYIGTEKGLEKDLVSREGLDFKAIEITGFKRSLSLENVKTIWRFLKGVSNSKKLLKEFKPDVVIGTGGYVCGPVVYAASKMKIPTIIHEQNSVPGLTNKFLSRYVNKVAISFEEARQFFPKEKVVFTGNPRGSEVVSHIGSNAIQQLGIKKGIPSVLIFGGSRGAKAINEAVLKNVEVLKDKPYQVIYITGDVHYQSVKEELDLVGTPDNVIVKPFIHNMPEILPSVDLVVSRAGATTLAELTALGIASILIPSPYVTNNHQEKNAQALVQKGAATMIKESELNGSTLIKAIDEIMLDTDRIESMKKSAKQMGIPDSAERLLKMMQDLQ
jgi:UDP-N-acetylglucosamine--N-acetylmuramyl-(pentapeptide) pyrophosphoryl-undecaprenol N-acetylglucosamine transferase